MNTAASKNQAHLLRDWMIASDEWLSPQAAVLSPTATCRMAQSIVSTEGTYARTIAAGREAARLLNEGAESKRLKLSIKEQRWLDRIETELAGMPEDENELVDEMIALSKTGAAPELEVCLK